MQKSFIFWHCFVNFFSYFQYLEWISSKSSRTSTNSHMIIDLTISSRSTRQLTRINTFVILTSLIIATFRIWNTIATNASGIRIAFVSRLTLADGPSSFIATIGVCSTNLDDGTRIRKTSRPEKKQFRKKICIFTLDLLHPIAFRSTQDVASQNTNLRLIAFSQNINLKNRLYFRSMHIKSVHLKMTKKSRFRLFSPFIQLCPFFQFFWFCQFFFNFFDFFQFFRFFSILSILPKFVNISYFVPFVHFFSLWFSINYDT